MKLISIVTLAACLLVWTAATAEGQNRRRTTSSRGGRTSSTRSQPSADAMPARAAAARVADQIKSLGRFLYLYGPVSKELTASDTGAASQSAAVSETMQRNRAKLADVFRDYRMQMDELETTFSNSSELRPYYTKLLGVAARAAQAEEAVAAGRYNDAGNSLLEVMTRLTDVLLDMP
ncbi:MAG TPA: hypothetical protein VF544_23900 [Pyrinomonadaceae bacterium]